MVDREPLTFEVDLGGTSTRVCLYDSDMRPLASATITTRVSSVPQSCVEEIAEVIRSVGHEGGSLGRQNTLGIDSPGTVISAQRVFERLGHYFGMGLANLMNTLDVPLIVVGRGWAGSWKLLSPPMFHAVREYSRVYRLGEPTKFVACDPDRISICPAVLDPSAGLIGAALLPRPVGLCIPLASTPLSLEVVQ